MRPWSREAVGHGGADLRKSQVRLLGETSDRLPIVVDDSDGARVGIVHGGGSSSGGHFPQCADAGSRVRSSSARWAASVTTVRRSAVDNSRRLSTTLLAITLLVAACGSPPAATPADATAEVSTGRAFAERTCAGSTYRGCVESVVFAMSSWSGETVAICEYEGGTGDVTLIEAGEDPDEDCSGGGLIPGSRVFAVLRLP